MEPIQTNSLPLPSMRQQLASSFLYIKKRYDVLLLLSVTSLPITMLSRMIETAGDDFGSVPPAWWILSLVAALVSPVVACVAMYCALHPESNPTLKQSWHWVWTHFGALVWLLTLSPVILFGAMLFLVIPAVVLSVYMALIFAVFVYEDRRGFAAVWRSHQLVYGHWWTIFGRIVGLTLIYSIAAGIFSVFGPIGALVGGVVQMAGTLALYYLTYDFYHAFLSEDQTMMGQSPARSTRFLYKLFAWVGAILLVAVVVGVSILITMALGSFAP